MFLTSTNVPILAHGGYQADMSPSMNLYLSGIMCKNVRRAGCFLAGQVIFGGPGGFWRARWFLAGLVVFGRAGDFWRARCFLPGQLLFWRARWFLADQLVFGDIGAFWKHRCFLKVKVHRTLTLTPSGLWTSISYFSTWFSLQNDNLFLKSEGKFEIFFIADSCELFDFKILKKKIYFPRPSRHNRRSAFWAARKGRTAQRVPRRGKSPARIPARMEEISASRSLENISSDKFLAANHFSATR